MLQFNPFSTNVPLIYPAKTSEKLRFSDALRENGLKEKPTFLLWLRIFSFLLVINYLLFDFFTKFGGISAKSITITKNSLLSELLDMTIHKQVNVHDKHISETSNFSAKCFWKFLEFNKLNLSCIGYCKFL